MWNPFRNRRRARLRATPLPGADAALIERNVPLVGTLNDADRAELHGATGPGPACWATSLPSCATTCTAATAR